MIAIPVIRMLYELVLVQTGLGSIAYDRISHVLRNPLADVTLLVIAVVAVIAILAELVTLFMLASHHQNDDTISPRMLPRQIWETIKKLARPQGLLMIVYLILLLPLGQLGLTSILTKKVAVPPFVSEELSKNPSSSLLYSAVLLVISYLNLRLIFTLPLLGTTSAGVWQSFVDQLAADALALATGPRSARGGPVRGWGDRIHLGRGDFAAHNCYRHLGPRYLAVAGRLRT
jgi:glycerophosphoryl diester phosphodiesterase